MPSSTRFHLSLNTSNLREAVAFYRVLFGLEPAKLHDDYAKFELTEPPVVFSLAPHPVPPGNSLHHLGMHVPDADSRRRLQARLEEAGAAPDHVYWEIDEASAPPPRAETAAPRNEAAIWEHYVTNAVPERIPHADGSLDEVRLTGTFNARLDDRRRRHLLAEAWRALKPGGMVMTHGLMADHPFPAAQPTLPGLGALVARIPLHTEPLDAFRAAGFVSLQFVKFTEAPWFVHDGVEMREVKLVGRRPDTRNDDSAEVIYKGPFRQASDEFGQVYIRGQTTKIPRSRWHGLRRSAAEQFLFLEAGVCC